MITNEDRIYIQPILKGTSLNPLLAPASKISLSIPMASQFINHFPLLLKCCTLSSEKWVSAYSCRIDIKRCIYSPPPIVVVPLKPTFKTASLCIWSAAQLLHLCSGSSRRSSRLWPRGNFWVHVSLFHHHFLLPLGHFFAPHCQYLVESLDEEFNVLAGHANSCGGSQIWHLGVVVMRTPTCEQKTVWKLKLKQ